MAQIELHRTEIAETRAKKSLQMVGPLFDKFIGEAHLNRMFLDVFLVAPLDHFPAHHQRQTRRAWKGSAGRRENQFLDPFRVFQSDQLRHAPDHRVAENNRLVDLQMIQKSNRIVAKHPGREIDRRLARPSGAAIVVDDDPVILGELGNLKKLPDLPIARSLAKKYERLSLAVHFIVNFGVFALYCWHLALQVLTGCLTALSESFDEAQDERREFNIVDVVPFMLSMSKNEGLEAS